MHLLPWFVLICGVTGIVGVNEITPLPRALPPPATSRDKRPHTPSRPRPVDATPEDDSSPPPGTQIFRVPSIDDDGPPEWREPLFPKGRGD